MPTRTFFGGAVRDELDYFGFLQGDDPETLAAHARQLAGEGHRVIYLKVGRGARDDDACVAAVREAIGPEPLLRIDPNEAWDVATAVDRIRRLEQYDLDWVEQPVPAQDVAGLAHVRRSVETKIAADQAVFTIGQLREVLAKEAADVIVQGSHDAGGLYRFKQQAFICEAHGLRRQPARVHGERDQLPRERAGRGDDPEPDARQPGDAPAARRAAHARRPRPRSTAAASASATRPGTGSSSTTTRSARAHERWQRDGAYNTIESRQVKGAETIVVGGGILGATTLWELAREGMEPLLLEAGRFGEASTGKSAAIVRCHYSNPEVVRMAVPLARPAAPAAAAPRLRPGLHALRLALPRRRRSRRSRRPRTR